MEHEVIDEPPPDEYGCQGIRKPIDGSDERGSTMRFEFRYRSRSTFMPLFAQVTISLKFSGTLEALGCILRPRSTSTTGLTERPEPGTLAPLPSSATRDHTEQPRVSVLADSPPAIVAPAATPILERLVVLQTGVSTFLEGQPVRSQPVSRTPLLDRGLEQSSHQSEVDSDRASVDILLQERIRPEQDNHRVDFPTEPVQASSIVKEEAQEGDEGVGSLRRKAGRAEARRAVIV